MKPSNQHYALIMAGGMGERFAPLSTPEKPKQFLNLLDPNRTLLQQTFDRLAPLFPPENILVATNKRHVPLVQQQLPLLSASQIFGETHKKNTAPCLAWVSSQLLQENKKAILMAIPSDQFMAPLPLFHETLKRALHIAESRQAIVTIGIRPTFPSTHHGYLHKESSPIDGEKYCFKVKEFVEKPGPSAAAEYFKNGNYYWNGGTFIFPVEKMVAAVQKHLPDIFSLLKKEISLEDFFAQAPSISIDYGVMEKEKELLLVEALCTWSDAGTWESLRELQKSHSLTLPAEVIQILQQK